MASAAGGISNGLSQPREGATAVSGTIGVGAAGPRCSGGACAQARERRLHHALNRALACLTLPSAETSTVVVHNELQGSLFHPAKSYRRQGVCQPFQHSATRRRAVAHERATD